MSIFTKIKGSTVFTKVEGFFTAINGSAFAQKMRSLFSSGKQKFVNATSGADQGTVTRTIGSVISKGIFTVIAKVVRIPDMTKFERMEGKVSKILNLIIRSVCVAALVIFAALVLYYFFKFFTVIVAYAAMAVAMALGYKLLMGVVNTAVGKKVVAEEAAAA